MQQLASEMRSLTVQRRGLLLEWSMVVAAGALLAVLAPLAEGGTRDIRFGFGAAVAIFSVAAVRAVAATVELVHRECPRCARNFFGLSRRVPSPARRRCAHCGFRIDAPRGHTG